MTITTATLTPELLDTIVEYALGRYPEPDDHVNWDDLLVRLEEALEIDLPNDMLDPAIRKIQRSVRAARKTST